MKTQVFTIHGGEVWNSYEEYLEWLTNTPVSLEDFSRTNWKKSLSEKLGEDFAVYALRMPNGSDAKHIEWKIWFEKFIPYFTDGVVFIGHSLGGMFLAKYLSENRIPVKIGATFLMAASYTLPDNPTSDFNFPGPLTLFGEQSKIFLYQSKDDTLVPFSDFEKYQTELPNAEARIFTDKEHFVFVEELPELVEDIQSLAR